MPRTYINDGASLAETLNERGYYYFHYILKDYIINTGFRYGIESGGKEIMSGNFSIEDIFIQKTIEKEKYTHNAN